MTPYADTAARIPEPNDRTGTAVMNAKEDVIPPLVPPLTHVIYRAEEIQTAVTALAVEILAGTPYDGDLVLLVVLEGARRFGNDLLAAMAALPQAAGRKMRLATVGVSSYGHALQSSGKVDILAAPSEALEDRDVVIIDDILDQGFTMRCLLEYCAERRPASLKSCVLFDKRDIRRDFRPDYVGLEVPPVFVVGYGLDYQENFRNLPYLAALDAASTVRGTSADAQALPR